MPQNLTGRYNPKMGQEKVPQDRFQILGVQQAPLFWSPWFSRHPRWPAAGNRSSPPGGNSFFRVFAQAVSCPKQGGLRHTSAFLNESVRASRVPRYFQRNSVCLPLFPLLNPAFISQIGPGVCKEISSPIAIPQPPCRAFKAWNQRPIGLPIIMRAGFPPTPFAATFRTSPYRKCQPDRTQPNSWVDWPGVLRPRARFAVE